MVRRLGVGLGMSTKKKHKVDSLLWEQDDASQKRNLKEDDQQQHPRDGEERLPAEAGSGSVTGHGSQKRGEDTEREEVMAKGKSKASIRAEAKREGESYKEESTEKPDAKDKFRKGGMVKGKGKK